MGALTKENKKALSGWMDKKINFNNVLIEMVDGPLFSIAINILDEKVFSRVPEDLHDELNDTVQAITEDRYEDASTILGDVLAGVIPTPLVDGTEEEKILYTALLTILVSLIPKPAEPQK